MSNNESMELAQNFMEMLWVIHNNFFRQKTMPLPLNQFSVLMTLHCHSETHKMSISEISHHLKVSKQQMTTIIEKLMQIGYIDKQPNPRDKRCSIISISDKGQKLIDADELENLKDMSSKLALLNEAEIKEFNHTIENLKALMLKISSNRA